MKIIWKLTQKELNHAFNSWTFYSGSVLFFSVCGFYCWLSDANIFRLGQASMLPFFVIIKWLFLFLVPIFSMRSIAEERKTGTLELLLTKPIRTSKLIVAKFCSIFMTITILLLLTTPYYCTIEVLGNVDGGQVLSGYLGLLLMAAFYIAIGICASSAAKGILNAFFLSFSVILCFQFLFEFLAGICRYNFISEILLYLSVVEHFDALSRGVIDSRDIFYFSSLTLLFLVLTQLFIYRSRN